MPPVASQPHGSTGLRLTERDRRLLRFAAEHRLVIERQLERLIGIGDHELRRRLRSLMRAGYLSGGRAFEERHYQIRQAGLAVIDSTLPVPRFSPAAYRHDVGVAWLWLAAHLGAFGPLQAVLAERSLRSGDGALERPPEPYGVRLGGLDRHGRERLHYPDLMLVDLQRRRLALELELTPKGRERRESILGGYAADVRIDRALYLAEDNPRGRAIRRLVETSVREMGLSDQIRVQLVKPIRAGPQERAAGRSISARQVELTEAAR